MKLPAGAAFVLNRLNQKGYQAYVVGGCVRDALLGRAPKDWDVCTSALPEEMQRIFADCHVIETGLKHGTLTVMYEHEPYEATTFRVDGAYTDHRHPDEVIFVADVKEDLARRDFTINAMAWNPDTGLVDAFGGREDLAKGIIRCVGDPEKRFGEDALRIMRALRFASVYGFDIEPETAAAIHRLKETLGGVAAERIRVELAKLLCGQGAGLILREYKDVMFTIIPQLKPMDGFDQHTPYHAFDVWEHTVQSVEHAPSNEVLRLTMLLHDVAKPHVFTLDEDGIGHAWGHQPLGAKIARQVLLGLKTDNATMERVTLLVEHHDDEFLPERRAMMRLLGAFGEEVARQLMDVNHADESAKGRKPQREIDEATKRLRTALEDVIASKPCVTLKDMAVNGRDLMASGFPAGKQLGETLNWLLDQLLDETLPNDRETLLRAASEHRKHI
ncbi:MAG: HD domain-containing protein [Clostridia bacterium]|nr:HD domain-containing protein [Clostridia bacterium]